MSFHGSGILGWVPQKQVLTQGFFASDLLRKSSEEKLDGSEGSRTGKAGKPVSVWFQTECLEGSDRIVNPRGVCSSGLETMAKGQDWSQEGFGGL